MSFLESPFNPLATFTAQTTTKNISSIDPKLSRTNYYDGRLLKASDLIRDQLYLDERLREVGRALGQGIVRGFDVKLTPQKKLIVNPGLAVTPSGRVLELENKTLEINLLDSAKIADLNQGFRSLSAGLYAVVVQYAEQGTGSAEVYPKDLESQRGFHFNAYSEGVEFSLVKLSAHLPLEKMRNLSSEDIAVHSRSALVRSLLMGNPGQPVGIGEDSVALGLLAVEFGEPQWLDRGLLRRPFRNAQALNYSQQDLYNHYEELLPAVVEMRRASNTQNQFLVQQYFSILPPVGSIPKASIDPINGYQNYFPEGFEVSISPVRADDVASIIQQSMALEPIDLQVDKDVDIMIAVVLDDINFSYLARQLQHRDLSGSGDFVQPAHLDEILLSDFTIQGDSSSTTATLWKKLWDAASQIFYVRRPVRVAETQVSAVVLAKGEYAPLLAIDSLPQPAEELETEIDDLTSQLNDLNQQLNSAQAKILELTKELNKPLDKKIKEAQAAQAAAEADAANQKEQVKILTDELAQAQSEKQAKDAELAEAKAAVDSANAQISDLTTQLASATAETNNKNNQIKKLTEQLSNAKIALDSANAEIEDLKNQLAKALDEIKFLKDNSGNSQAIDDLKKQLEESQTALKNANTSLDDAKVAIDKSNSQIANLQSQLKEAQLEIEKLKAQLGNAVTTPGVDTKPKLTAEDLAAIKVLKLAQIIPASLEIAAADRDTIKAAVAADSNLLTPLSQLKAIVPEQYQTPLWATVSVIIETAKLQDFVDFVVNVLQKSLPLGLAVAATTKFKLSTSLRNSWSSIDLG